MKMEITKLLERAVNRYLLSLNGVIDDSVIKGIATAPILSPEDKKVVASYLLDLEVEDDSVYEEAVVIPGKNNMIYIIFRFDNGEYFSDLRHTIRLYDGVIERMAQI